MPRANLKIWEKTKMKKITELLFAAVFIASFIFIAGEKGLAQYSKSDDCSRQMAEETLRYMQNSKISFKSSSSEFYSNEKERVYVLSSEDKVNLKSAKSEKRVVAVINLKSANNTDEFYTIESEFREDSIVYSLKKESRVLQTKSVKIIIPPPSGDPFCEQINKQTKAQIAQMQQQANATCAIFRMCFPMCKNGQIIGYMMVRFTPQNPACYIEISTNQSYLVRIFDSAPDKDSGLFTYKSKE
jgi:hypothetical protein